MNGVGRRIGHVVALILLTSAVAALIGMDDAVLVQAETAQAAASYPTNERNHRIMSASAVRSKDHRPGGRADRRLARQIDCRNSTNPLCGPFHWSSDPGDNALAAVSVDCSTTTPRVGEPVTCSIHVEDPDAAIDGFSVEYPGLIDPIMIAKCDTHPYGAWDPPARAHGEETFTWTHTFNEPGPAELRFHGYSGDPYWASVGNARSDSESVHCGTPRNPYESRATLLLTMTVQDATRPAESS